MMKCLGVVAAIIVALAGIVIVQKFADVTLCWPLELENNFVPAEKLRNEMVETKMNAFVVGATGEVGKALVRELAKAEAIGKVTLIIRRKIELPLKAGDEGDYSKFEQKIVDFEKLKAEHASAFEGHDVGFCALGTTRGKAGADGFVRVDHDYVVDSARLAKTGGCKHFNLVSSQGANKNGWLLYPRVKGIVEEEVKGMNFDRLSIWQPGMLLVDREESRPMEKLIQLVVKPLDFCRYSSVDVPLFAKVMVQNSLHSYKAGPHTYSNRDIYALAKEFSSK